MFVNTRRLSNDNKTPAYSRSSKLIYRKTSYISHTLLGNKIVDTLDVVGASPVGAAPTTS